MKKFISLIKKTIKTLKVLKIFFYEITYSLAHKNYIVHIGHYSKGKKMTGNVGDPILYNELEVLYDP